jgi:hypothetical protein
MSVSFYGLKPDGSTVYIDFDHPAYLNMANSNARAFLTMLMLDPELWEAAPLPVPEARRALMAGKALFEKRVGKVVRETHEYTGSGGCHVIEHGTDQDYFERRLQDFERFLNVVAEAGATSIYWS